MVDKFSKAHAEQIIDQYDILVTLESDNEMEHLEQHNPELAKALYALYRFAYVNEAAGEDTAGK